MKLQDIKKLNEAPLPPDWDKEKFDKNKTSYSKMINYAKERSKQMGSGSSRVAFLVPYEGRQTILKVAKNYKGLAQNIEEINLLGDWYLKDIDITIPMIDHDENENNPTWIHMEYAQKITLKQLEKFFEYPIDKILMYLDYQQNGNRTMYGKKSLPDNVYENEYFQALQDLVLNYDLPVWDFSRKANWGLYNGKPVIIDLGYTSNVVKLYS
jgi:hypothetical protein